MNMTLSDRGLTLIKDFEAPGGVPVLQAYRDIVGVWTNGFGNTHGVSADSPDITTEQATTDLLLNVSGAEFVVNKVVTVALNQNQFDALVDFVFNLGSGAFQASTLLRKLNNGDYLGASAEILKWNHAGGSVIAGLTRRRLAEQSLFNS